MANLGSYRIVVLSHQPTAEFSANDKHELGHHLAKDFHCHGHDRRLGIEYRLDQIELAVKKLSRGDITHYWVPPKIAELAGTDFSAMKPGWRFAIWLIDAILSEEHHLRKYFHDHRPDGITYQFYHRDGVDIGQLHFTWDEKMPYFSHGPHRH